MDADQIQNIHELDCFNQLNTSKSGIGIWPKNIISALYEALYKE